MGCILKLIAADQTVQERNAPIFEVGKECKEPSGKILNGSGIYIMSF